MSIIKFVMQNPSARHKDLAKNFLTDTVHIAEFGAGALHLMTTRDDDYDPYSYEGGSEHLPSLLLLGLLSPKRFGFQIAHALQKRGHDVHIPETGPSLFRGGPGNTDELYSLMQHNASFIDSNDDLDGNFNVITHSLGALIILAICDQCEKIARRIKSIFCISPCIQGSPFAEIVTGQLVGHEGLRGIFRDLVHRCIPLSEQLSPDSAAVNRLRQFHDRITGIALSTHDPVTPVDSQRSSSALTHHEYFVGHRHLGGVIRTGFNPDGVDRVADYISSGIKTIEAGDSMHTKKQHSNLSAV